MSYLQVSKTTNNRVNIFGPTGAGYTGPQGPQGNLGPMGYTGPQPLGVDLSGGWLQGEKSINAINLGNYNPVLAGNSVSVGFGSTGSGNGFVSIGFGAGNSNSTTTIGYNAGQYKGSYAYSAVAIGSCAGQYAQSHSSVAVGSYAGQTGQGPACISLGCYAGQIQQGQYATAIGAAAGTTNQGQNAVAIGYQAGTQNQEPNTIILNATNGVYNGTSGITGAFHVKPVRQTGTGPSALFYDASSGEISYGAISGSGGGSGGTGPTGPAGTFSAGTNIVAGTLTTTGGNNSVSKTTGSIVSGGGLAVLYDSFIGGNLTIENTTGSTSSSTGALIVGGGAGIGGDVNISGVFRALNGSNSLSKTTGSVVVSGGLGVNYDMFVGGNVNAGNFFSSTGIINTTNAIVSSNLSLTASQSGAFLEATGSANFQIILPTMQSGSMSFHLFLNTASSSVVVTIASSFGSPQIGPLIGVYSGGTTPVTSTGITSTTARLIYIASDGTNWCFFKIA